ncbi:MAG: 5-formyltetrahydrofolate cyclo-ligase [Planctomycetaceae bacterium]
MRSDELKKAKRAVRRAVLAARDAVPEVERARRGARVAERFLGLPEVMAAGSVLLFWSFGSEVPTPPLIEALHARGVRTALPRIVEGEIEVRSFLPGDPMTETSFGAREPSGGERLAEVDVVCTPGVAFDLGGRRIGYGGGFYDRLLPGIPAAARIAIAFDLQVREEPLPSGRFDEPVDALVTESRVLRWDRPR